MNAKKHFFLWSILLLGIAILIWAVPKEINQTGTARYSATYVGSQSCATCHTKQYQAWSGSHHDLAMQSANEVTVLGNFGDESFTHFGIATRFFKKDRKFFVNTEGPDGKMADFEIKYTFGVHPLQQYLVEFEDGRLQALTIAWDTERNRWFDLYPDERIPHDDVLHWTGLNQNWNFMCAECHSTNVKKNYDFKTNTFKTTWTDINVSCEACHGPASEHLAWARGDASSRDQHARDSKGLVIELKGQDSAIWIHRDKTGTAKRSPARSSNVELTTCARCHARRSLVSEKYVHGRAFMDTHRPVLLDESHYYADGQINEEVYVYGSFLQSKMYHAGVRCSDCHDAHTSSLRSSRETICLNCHKADVFASPNHHHHKTNSAGSQCIACHMPKRNYMIVDPRHDHSFRVPRPDLSLKLGTPNACQACHSDQSAQWAANAVAKWYGPRSESDLHYGEILHASQQGFPGAKKKLLLLAQDQDIPGIVRATAISLLEDSLGPEKFPILESQLKDSDPLVRMSALAAVENLAPESRLRIAARQLNDPILSVRIEAARVLSSIPRDLMTAAQRSDFDSALAEYREAQWVNADRPSAHLNLGIIDMNLGDLKAAQRSYARALSIDSSFVPAYVNIADIYRVLGQDEKGEALLRRALDIVPQSGELHYALGLLLVREKRYTEEYNRIFCNPNQGKRADEPTIPLSPAFLHF